MLGVLGGSTGASAQTADGSSNLAPEEATFQQLLEVPSTYGIGVSFLSEPADNTTSMYRPTLPNFWWSRDQLPTVWRVTDGTTVRVAGYRLIRNWTAFRSTTIDAAVVDVQVDPQYWNRFNYYQQYAVLRQLGTNGLNYGYHVRIYNSIDLVGIYACDFADVQYVAASPGGEIPWRQIDEIDCTAAIGPFVDYATPEFGDDLFAPP